MPNKFQELLTFGLKTGAQAPRYLWLTWSSFALAVLCILAAIRVVQVPFPPLAGAIALLAGLNAMRFAPRPGSDAPKCRHSPMLLLLIVPWLASVILGPLGFMPVRDDPMRKEWMLLLQHSFLAARAILPLLLLIIMRHARRFTLAIGVLNILLCFWITSVSIRIIVPAF